MQVVIVALAAVAALSKASIFDPTLYGQEKTYAQGPGTLKKDKNRGLKLVCNMLGRSATTSVIMASVKRNMHHTNSHHSSHNNNHHSSSHYGSKHNHPLGGLLGGPKYGFNEPSFGFKKTYESAAVSSHKHGHHDHTLKAQFTITSAIFGNNKYKLIVTERSGMASTGEFCISDLFGSGVKFHYQNPHSKSHQYGAGPVAFHEHQHDHQGVVAEVTLMMNSPRTLTLAKLKGFTDLEQLAGRGLIVCPRDSVGEDAEGRATCSALGDQIPVCCAFVYEKDTHSSG